MIAGEVNCEAPKITDSFTVIIEHLLIKYHEPTKNLLKHLIAKGRKFVEEREPGAGLTGLSEKITELASELAQHMEKEERVLFPYLLQLDEAESIPEMHCGSVRNPIIVMEREHEDTLNLFGQIEKLTDNFKCPEESSNTQKILFAGLKNLIDETHKHIDIENNILFPKTLQHLENFSD